MTWRELVARSAAQLDEHEARMLVGETAGMSASELWLRLDESAPLDAPERLDVLVSRRVAGEPLQHVLGHWSFRDLELRVDRRALVPRPETEIVVGFALEELDRLGTPHPLVLDIGTGTGAIACSIAHEREQVIVLGIDADLDALSLAAENRALMSPGEQARLLFVACEYYGAITDSARASLIVSNPPYLSSGEWEVLDPVVKDFDPRRALVAGDSGLESIAAVLEGAYRHLKTPGSVVLEIAPHQTEEALRLARSAGAEHARVQVDLAGRERVLVARYGHDQH